MNAFKLRSRKYKTSWTYTSRHQSFGGPIQYNKAQSGNKRNEDCKGNSKIVLFCMWHGC